MSEHKQTVSLVLGSGGARGYATEIIINIPNDACGFYEFNRAYEMIELGRMIAKESITE